jgi:hypothetical protein
MEVMEIASHPACASETAQFLKIVAAEDIDGHIGVVADIEAALSLVGREVHGHSGAGHFGLRISALADETLGEIAALSRVPVRIAARLAQIRIETVEHLDTVVAAVADIELAVIGNLGAMHRVPEGDRLFVALCIVVRPAPAARAAASSTGLLP